MNKSQIFFQNKKHLEKKIQKIKQDGLDKLHIVSDFDRTLTKSFFNGKKIPSTIALIREGGYLSKYYPEKAFALFDKYHPFEINYSVDYEFRFNKMQEWWATHEKLLVKSGMNKDVIKDILNKFPKIFREGSLKFFDFLKENNIPILIFSSGIGNFIEEYLKKENKLSNNIKILSNTFEFDSEGFATGYKDKIIHIMNKSETKMKDSEYKRMIAERKNIILLGDSLEDLGMINDLESNTVISIAQSKKEDKTTSAPCSKNSLSVIHAALKEQKRTALRKSTPRFVGERSVLDRVISIGFLNENIESNLELYLSNFDVVITNDGTMDFVNDLLKQIQN